MPKVVITFEAHSDLFVERVPKEGDLDLTEDQVWVDIPSGLFNEYMRVQRRMNDLNDRMAKIWTHAQEVGSGRRYG